MGLRGDGDPGTRWAGPSVDQRCLRPPADPPETTLVSESALLLAATSTLSYLINHVPPPAVIDLQELGLHGCQVGGRSSVPVPGHGPRRLGAIALFRDPPCGETDHRDAARGLLLAETRRWLHLHAAAARWLEKKRKKRERNVLKTRNSFISFFFFLNLFTRVDC